MIRRKIILAPLNYPFLFLFVYFTIGLIRIVNAQTGKQQNLDSTFLRCQKIIFNDDLNHALLNKTDSNWEVLQGSHVVETISGIPVLSFKGAGFSILKPISLTGNYLNNEFTIDFDLHRMKKTSLWQVDSGLLIYLNNQGNKSQSIIAITNNNSEYVYPDTKKYYPDPRRALASTNSEVKSENVFFPKPNNHSDWDHISISYYNRRLRVFVDYILVSDIANTELSPTTFLIGVQSSINNYVSIKNFKVSIPEPSQAMKNFLAVGKMTTYAITFDNNSASIKPASISFISDVADLLKENPNIKIEINGFTDNVGKVESNIELSNRRAAAVKNELVSMGILSSRITTHGLGESNPIGDNSTEDGKAKNRRIEFVILK